MNKGYKRVKTVSYTIEETVKPLENAKGVQLSFPFPDNVKVEKKPVIKSFKFKDNNRVY